MNTTFYGCGSTCQGFFFLPTKLGEPVKDVFFVTSATL